MASQSPFFGKRERDAEPLTSRPAPLGSGTNLSGAPLAPPSSLTTPAANATAAAKEGGSKLTVGPNIKLKGVEITDCDTLVVEGSVEATMDSRVIQISEQGAFKGSAEIDVAEIRGEFNGNLTVRQKLVIEEGGQLSGEILFGALAAAKPAAVKPGLQAV